MGTIISETQIHRILDLVYRLVVGVLRSNFMDSFFFWENNLMYQKFINLVLVLAKTHYNCYFDKGVRVTKKKKSLKGAQGFVRKPLAFGQKFREKKKSRKHFLHCFTLGLITSWNINSVSNIPHVHQNLRTPKKKKNLKNRLTYL